jgi:hypothetical protein
MSAKGDVVTSYVYSQVSSGLHQAIEAKERMLGYCRANCFAFLSLGAGTQTVCTRPLRPRKGS